MIAVGDTVWLGAIVGVVIIAALVLGRNISAKLGSVAIDVAAVNKAVNARKPGQPTISDQVASTAARVEGIHTAMELLATATSNRISDVDRAIDSLGRRLSEDETANALTLAALSDRVSALEINQSTGN